MIVIVIVSGLFIFSIRIQRRVLAQQELLDQVSFVEEYMSRALRTAKKDLAPTCLTQAGLNYEITRSGKGIKFINDRDECTEFYWDDAASQLRESRAGVDNLITASSLRVLRFSAALRGASQTDAIQPRAAFFMELERISQRAEEQVSIKLQSTVSQRDLDVVE